MAQAVTFQVALACIGFPQPAVAALMTNDVTMTEDLIGLNQKDIKQILKIIQGHHPLLFPILLRSN